MPPSLLGLSSCPAYHQVEVVTDDRYEDNSDQSDPIDSESDLNGPSCSLQIVNRNEITHSSSVILSHNFHFDIL